MQLRTIINLLIVTVVVACAIAPVAAANIYLRSPDARDVAATPTVTLGFDLRSPDARDAALGRTTSDAPAAVVVTRESSSGFDSTRSISASAGRPTPSWRWSGSWVPIA